MPIDYHLQKSALIYAGSVCLLLSPLLLRDDTLFRLSESSPQKYNWNIFLFSTQFLLAKHVVALDPQSKI